MRFLSPPTAPVAASLPVSGSSGDILSFNNSLYCYLNGAWVALNNNTTAISDVSGLSAALAAKEPTITAGLATQYWRGDKSWQTLDKTAVGLGNVDNTSDVNKPLSTATTNALALKANLSGATFTGTVEFDNAAVLATAGLTWSGTLLMTDAPAAMTLGGTPPLQLGPTAANNIAVDRFGIQARNNSLAATLNLNLLGGATNIGGALVVTGAISGSNLSGTNTGDQTITLTGDVTGSGTGSFVAAIGANKVTFSKLVAATQAAFIGASSAGNFGEVTPTAATGMLTTFIGASGTVAGTKGLVPAPATSDYTNNAFLKADGTWSQIGYTNLSGTPALSTVATSGLASDLTGTLNIAQTPAFSGGDVTKASGSGTLTIASGAVTLAKMANLSANTIIGNNTGSAAAPIGLTGTQTTALLDVFTTSAKGLVPSPGAISGRVLSDSGAWVTVSSSGPTSWTPVTATGTGASQNITLPETGLATSDVLVIVEGMTQGLSDYSITGTTLTLTAPNTSDIVIRKLTAASNATFYRPFPFFFTTTPSSSELLAQFSVVESISIPPNFLNSVGHIGINPSATFILTVKKNGSTTIGTITVSTAGVIAWATTGGLAQPLVSGDYVTFEAPATADSTIANVSVTVKGQIT